jgi:antitoxin HigA-1
MRRLKNIHPGNVLVEEFLTPNRLTVSRLAREIHCSKSQLVQIVEGTHGITANTALRLSKYFGNTPKFWLGLQNDYDLEIAKAKIK